jgi:VWFA-related protein
MKRVFTGLLICFFCLCRILTSSSEGGGLSPSRQEGQQAKIDSRLQHDVVVARKLIYVLVTDRQGRPVTDLQKDEFTLFDNGQQKTITEFETHMLSLPGTERPPLPSAAVEQAPTPPAPLMNRTFLFLFDLVFEDPGGFRLGRQAAMRFLETDLKPGDLVGVLSFSGGRSLNVLHRPDGERAQAKRAIESIALGNLMPVAPIRPSELGETTITTSANADSSFFGGPVSGESKVGRVVAGNFIWALDSLAQALRYTPGRKIIVLYSNGLHPSYLSRGPYFQTGNADLGSAYQALCHKLAAASASVFSVNTEENTFLVRQVPESRKGVSSLREITSGTGGRFLGDIYAVPDHLQEIDTLTGAYYVLGYPIMESWDGRYHKIKVKVSRPGCEVSAQPGYFNAKPYTAYSDLEKKIHLIDLALSAKPLSQEPVRLVMQALPWAPAPRDDIRFVAEIPIGRLGDIAGPLVEAVSLVFNDLDELIDTRRVELDLTRPELGGKRVFLQASLSVPPGHYKCRVVLRNMETGQAGVAAASTFIPKPDPNDLMLFPPLFLIPGGPAIYLDGGTANGQLASRSLTRNFSIEPGKYVPLFEEPLQGDSEISAFVRCAASAKAVAGLTLESSMKDPTTGEIISVPLIKVAEEAEKDGRSFLLRLKLPRVPQGVYIIEIATNAQGSSSRIARRIQII